MSKLAELLRTPRQKLAGSAATLATVATNRPASAVGTTKSSNSSRGSKPETLAPSLVRRLRAHAERWQYSPAELADLLEWARKDPSGWLWYIARAERRAALAAQAAELARSGLSDQAIANAMSIDLDDARKLLLIDPACSSVAHLFLAQAS